MRRLLVLLGLLLYLLFSGRSASVKAQNYKYTCDACGYCQYADNSQPPGNWEACTQCLYGSNNLEVTLNNDPDPNKAFTVFGCLQVGANCDVNSDPECMTKAGAASFANFFLNFFTTIIGALAFLVMLYGGFRVLMARGDPDAMREGKRYVYGAILGLIIVFGSVLIIKIIGGSLLQIPFLQ